MQKVVAFLEKNVQWVAIALGAGFLLWMIYGYVIQKPVTVPVAGTPLTPGQVDDKTLTGPGRQLETLTKGTTAPPMPVQEFLTSLQAAFNNSDATKTSLASAWTSNFYASSQNIVIVPEEKREPIKDPVVMLPAAPAPTDLKTSDGRSTVTIPLPAVAGAPPAPPVANSGVDVNWITVGATLPVKQLAANFKTSKIPETLATNMTTLLRIDLERQEQNGDGTWTDSTPIEPLKTVTLLPLPPETATPEQGEAYRLWAETAQISIAQPAMYSVIQGDAWRIPGGQIPVDTAALAAAAAFDPSKVNDTRLLTPEQRKIYDAYQRQADQMKRDAARQKYLSRKGGGGSSGGPGGPGGGGPGAGPGGGGFGGGGPGGGADVAADDAPPILLAQVPPGYGRPPGGNPNFVPGMADDGPRMPGMLPPGMGEMPGMMQPNSGNQAVDSANAALLAAAQATLPKGSFNPAEQPDIVVWSHDTTVAPGKTYRYRVRYYLKNPVFQTKNVCKTPELENQFLLTSEFSDWTDAISVKSVTNFYAVNTSPTKDSVKFDIFRWKNGSWQVNTIDATPGDLVGSPRGDGSDKVDFSTGWTLVDVRNDPRNVDNKIIILTTDNGETLRKDLSVDRSSPEYKNLKSQVDGVKPTAAGTPAADPGATGLPPTPQAPQTPQTSTPSARQGRSQGGGRRG